MMETLDLSGKALIRVPTEELQGHIYKVVILANNKILKIDPITHEESEYIEELSLASNRLVKIENLSRLSNLRILRLPRNSISRLENLDALIHLKYCDLSHNNIKSIDNLEKNKELEHLDLSYNGIRSIATGALSSLSSLKTLLLGHNMLKSVEESAVHLPLSITCLGLDYNDIHGVHNLSILSGFPNLTEISLCGNPLIPSLASHIDSVPLVARLLPNVKSVDGKEITSKQRETALALFGDDTSDPSSSPSSRLGRLLDPTNEQDLAIYLSKRGKPLSSSQSSPSSSPRLPSSSVATNSPTLSSSSANGVLKSSISQPTQSVNPTSPVPSSDNKPSTSTNSVDSKSQPPTDSKPSEKHNSNSFKSSVPTSTSSPSIESPPVVIDGASTKTRSSRSRSASPSTAPSTFSSLPSSTPSSSVTSSSSVPSNASSLSSSTSSTTPVTTIASPDITKTASNSKPTPKSKSSANSSSTSSPVTSSTAPPKDIAPNSQPPISIEPNSAPNSNTSTNASPTSKPRPKTKSKSETNIKPPLDNSSTSILSPIRPRTPPPPNSIHSPIGSPMQAYPFPFSPFPPTKSPRAGNFPISESAVYLSSPSGSPPVSSTSRPTANAPNAQPRKLFSENLPPLSPTLSLSNLPQPSLSPTSSSMLSPTSSSMLSPTSASRPPISPRSVYSTIQESQMAALFERMAYVEARFVGQESALRELWGEVQFLRTIHLRHEHQAATLIQRHWRGYFTRKLYDFIKQDYRNHLRIIATYATTIQRYWRGHVSRKKYALMRKRTQTATQVQALVRGFLARRAYTRKVRKARKTQQRMAALENECVALRSQLSNLNKYVLALAALVKQSGQFPAPPPSPSSSSSNLTTPPSPKQ